MPRRMGACIVEASDTIESLIDPTTPPTRHLWDSVQHSVSAQPSSKGIGYSSVGSNM